jgi:hypothetical protein
MTNSDGIDVQGMYRGGDMERDSRASNARIVQKLGRRCVRDECGVLSIAMSAHEHVGPG